MKRVLFITTFLFVLTQWLFSQNNMREVVYLKNGSIIKGSIVEQTPNEFLKIETADGSLFICDINDVEKITKEKVSSSKLSKDYSGVEKRGYKGFADFGYTFGIGNHDMGRLELTSSHGYQFNPYLFLGLGTGLHFYSGGISLPVFVDFRSNLMRGAIVPFLGLKAGYTTCLSSGVFGLGCYFAPNIGVKFVTSSNKAINLSLGYTSQFYTEEESSYDPYYNYSYYYKGVVNAAGFSLKVGMEF